MSDDSTSLLKQYLHDRSQSAFTQIVNQYVDLVYASARRQVRDADLAQDVTQAVFLVLSQKAQSISPDRPLSAWLLTTTRYVAANARRAREHRHFHEQRAAQMAREITDTSREDQERLEELTPLLDEGLAKLGAGERDALVLKYFEKKSLRQVGEALGISEEAATKRVSRAVERLRVFFQRRGATVTVAALAAMLATESAQAAPVGLAASVATGASTSAATMAKGAIAVMTMQKLKAVAALVAIFVGGIAVSYVGVKAFSTSKHPGSVAIAPTPAAVTVPSASSSVALTFSDGTRVHVLGIGAVAPNGFAPWWAPDGSLVQRPGLRNLLGSAVQANADEMKRQIVLRTNAQAAGRLTIQFDPPAPSATSSSSANGETLLNCVFVAPTSNSTARLVVSLAGERQSLDVALYLKSGAATQPVATGR